MEEARRNLRFRELSSGLKMSQVSPSPSPVADGFLDASNSTLFSKAAALWSSPRGTVYRIEFFVLLAAVALCFLATFGSHRRRRKNQFIQKGDFGVYILSTSLLTYILGSMQSSEVMSIMYPFWAVSLYLLYGCSSSITAYTLEDNHQQKRLLYQSFQYYAYVAFLASAFVICQYYAYGHHPGQMAGPPILLCLCYTAVIRSSQRVAACRLASNSWNLNKMVVDYMHDDTRRKGALDSSTMQGCHYLVDWPLSKTKSGAPLRTDWSDKDLGEVIDIERVWMCDSKDISQSLKDTCLSFSMFHLLRRRCFGFACGGSKDWAPDIVLEVLLPKNRTDIDCERVFKVIEVELGFMYDFLYTKYASLYYASWASTTCWPLATAILISYAAYQAFTPIFIVADFGPPNGIQGLYIHLQKDEVVVTVLLVASIVMLELLQLLFYRTSIWGGVSFVCQHIRGERSRCVAKVEGLLAKIREPNQHLWHWQHRLGQYSLLESVSYSCEQFEENPDSLWRRFARAASRFFGYPGDVFLTETNYHARNIRGKNDNPIEVSAGVMKALLHSLSDSRGKLSMGGLSLDSLEELKWACEGDISSVVLIWHIATGYCEMVVPKLDLKVAAALSRYCAYLVVYAPKLLPGHHYDTKCVFDDAAIEAARRLCCSEDKYRAMKDMEISPESKTVFEQGVELGKQLEKMEKLGEMLANFWAGTMLYVAPSDNVKEHMEQLANGGELITHLWALLSHAGILKRDEHTQAKATQT